MNHAENKIPWQDSSYKGFDIKGKNKKIQKNKKRQRIGLPFGATTSPRNKVTFTLIVT
jgi:hypothetical protein